MLRNRWRPVLLAGGPPVMSAVRIPDLPRDRAIRGYFTPMEALYSLFFQLTPWPVKCL